MGTSEAVEVSCYSGVTYAERPRTFTWRGKLREVRELQRAWVAPDGRHFRVVSEDGQVFELRYDSLADRWYLKTL